MWRHFMRLVSSDEHKSTSSSEYEMWEDSDWDSDDSGDDPDW